MAAFPSRKFQLGRGGGGGTARFPWFSACVGWKSVCDIFDITQTYGNSVPPPPFKIFEENRPFYSAVVIPIKHVRHENGAKYPLKSRVWKWKLESYEWGCIETAGINRELLSKTVYSRLTAKRWVYVTDWCCYILIYYWSIIYSSEISIHLSIDLPLSGLSGITFRRIEGTVSASLTGGSGSARFIFSFEVSQLG